MVGRLKEAAVVGVPWADAALFNGHLATDQMCKSEVWHAHISKSSFDVLPTPCPSWLTARAVRS